jgi:chromosome segregation ATPase
MSNNVFQALQEGLQSIENNFGPYSSLFKQLANSESCCWSLQRQLQAIEPTLGSLETSVKTIELSETDLIRGLKSFSQVISEARIPAGNPALEKEIATKFGENTQLQLQLQQASIEAESLRKQVSSKVSENQHLQQSLAETVEASKDRISRLEMEKTALRGELEVLEQKVRGELTTASRRSQDEMKAKFGHEIRVLQTEKDRLEQDSNSLRSQLSNVQKSLVGCPWQPVNGTALTESRWKPKRWLRVTETIRISR